MPRASPVTGTFRLRSAPRRSATGRSRRPSWTLPSGRPRWLARTIRAPWASRARMVGRAARMRWSSVTLPSASGTLKSTRTKTRLPEASTSRMVSLSMDPLGQGRAGDPVGRRAGLWLGTVRRGRRPAAGRRRRRSGRRRGSCSPIRCRTSDDLDHRPADDHRRGGIDDRGATVAPEVGRHERLVRDAQDAGHWPCGRGSEGRVELLGGRLAPDIGGEVDDADRGRRDAQAEAVEPALEVRDDERQGLGRAGRRRDDVQAAPRAPGAGPCGPRRGSAGRSCSCGSCS